MSQDLVLAQIKAAAWSAVAALGYSKAIELMTRVLEEIKAAQWNAK